MQFEEAHQQKEHRKCFFNNAYPFYFYR